MTRRLIARAAAGTTVACAASLVLALTGCGGSAPAAQVSSTPAMAVGPENVMVVRTAEIRTGPAVSGSLTPEQVATVRAEVAGSLVETLVQEGESVRAGQELARIDDSAIRDAAVSARSAVTTAENSEQLAQREADRAQTLLQAGAIPERQQEQTLNALASAQSALADARSRLANAQKQLDKTDIKAPFDGVVSAKQVNAGDVVAVGGAIYTIVNPATMRLDANVPAEALSAVRIGSPVDFSVNGYTNRQFTGRVSRINPVADPATRQVRVTVSLPNENGTLVAGLFADGRVASETRSAPVIPTAAVDERGVRPYVMRLKGGVVAKAEVELGLRDATTESVEVVNGIAAGDTILIGAARGISPGTSVTVAPATDVKRKAP